jgi:hypothetical protein
MGTCGMTGRPGGLGQETPGNDLGEESTAAPFLAARCLAFRQQNGLTVCESEE